MVPNENVQYRPDPPPALFTVSTALSLGAFGNSDLSGFSSDESELILEKNPFRSVRALFPNAPIVSVQHCNVVVLVVVRLLVLICSKNTVILYRHC